MKLFEIQMHMASGLKTKMCSRQFEGVPKIRSQLDALGSTVPWDVGGACAQFFFSGDVLGSESRSLFASKTMRKDDGWFCLSFEHCGPVFFLNHL